MKSNIKIYALLLSILMVCYNCQDDNYQFGDIVTPSNIQITADIVGQDADNPNGDGSGAVNFTVTADNAISYKFLYEGNEFSTINGTQKIEFSSLGLNTYTVNVVAYGTAGVSASKAIQVEVLSTYSPPQDLLEKLYGTGSKTWRIKNEGASHFGLGPPPENPDLQDIFGQWFSAAPDSKAGVGMYDDRYIFNSDGTFTHITNSDNDASGNDTSGDIFGRDPLIYNDLGNSGAGTVDGADILNFPFEDYTVNWAITAPGGVETINLAGIGFIGYYTGGNHRYEIFDRQIPNELVLRTVDGNGEFYWWFTITSN